MTACLRTILMTTKTANNSEEQKMTQELAALMHLMDFGNRYIESHKWDVEGFRIQLKDFLLPNMDDWECAVTAFCVADLADHVCTTDEMPSAIQLRDAGDPGPVVMDRYMRIAWMYVSHLYFGEERPMRYATMT